MENKYQAWLWERSGEQDHLQWVYGYMPMVEHLAETVEYKCLNYPTPITPNQSRLLRFPPFS